MFSQPFDWDELPLEIPAHTAAREAVDNQPLVAVPPTPTETSSPTSLTNWLRLQPVSAAAKRLLKAQKRELGPVLRSMEGPADEYHKRSHWSWYVFPTSREGGADPDDTAVKDGADLNYVLDCEETREAWRRVLERLVEILKVQQSRRCLPSVDYGRIKYFAQEWDSALYREICASYPLFRRTLYEFIDTWTELSCPSLSQ